MVGYLIPPCTTSPSALQYLQYTATWQYAMVHCSVSHLIPPDLLRTPQTWRPSGTYFRRVHRISGYVGSCIPSPHLPQYTATWQYAMVHCSVSHWASYLTSQDDTDHGTLCNLLQEGTQDLRVCGIPLLGLTCYAVVPLTDCRMTSAAPTRDAVVVGL